MTILSNVFLTLSLLAYLFLVAPIVSGAAGRRANDGGAAMFAFIVTPVFWIALSLSTGAVDWMPMHSA